jgi:WD40 repeat protein
MQAYTGEARNIPAANTSAIKSILAASLPGSAAGVSLSRTAFLSNDGARILSINGNNGELSDAASGKMITVLKGHSDAISAGAFSLDGTLLATASLDRTTRIWDVLTGAQMAVLRVEDVVTAVAFSPDGRQLVTGAQNGTVRLWDVEHATLIATLLGHTAVINSVAYSPNGDQVISSSDDMTARIWSTNAKEEILKLDHSAPVAVAQFSLDERNALSATETAQAFVWSLPSGTGPVPFVPTAAPGGCVANRC